MTSFGFNLQLEEYSIDLALKTAEQTEKLGLQAVFVNDHYMKPSGNNIQDAFLMLTAMAIHTKRIKVGTARALKLPEDAPICGERGGRLDPRPPFFQ
jgi:alkanesulfonate monooxygenase SsuD/methylene tetrahydromethanopterin reductase-like flavin-dependent oxidoreductase (luciferase family)